MIYKLQDTSGNCVFTENHKLAKRICKENSNPFNTILAMGRASAPVNSEQVIDSYDEFLDYFY
jgi:hypothetical protein